MQRMTASPHDELATLRARAYGPRADIEADAEALARLRELEDAARRARGVGSPPHDPDEGDADAADARPVASGTGADAGAPPTSSDRAGGDAAPPAIDEADGRRSDPAPGVRGARARPIALAWLVGWAASVLVVAVLVGGIVFALASVRPVTASGATQIESLTDPVDPPDWLSQWFPQGADPLAFSYNGLIVARAPGGPYGAGRDSHCLFVADENAFNQSDGSITGQMYTGCGVSAFPATVQFVVDQNSTAQLREAFPKGTALQFVLDGDMVGVFAVAAPAPSPTAG